MNDGAITKQDLLDLEDRIVGKISGFEIHTLERFDKIDNRLGKVDSRLGKVEDRVGKVENQQTSLKALITAGFDTMNERFDRVEARLDTLEILAEGLKKKLQKVEVRIDGLEVKFSKVSLPAFIDGMDRRETNAWLGRLDDRFENIEDNLKGIYESIDSLRATYAHQLKWRPDLEKRVQKVVGFAESAAKRVGLKFS